MSNITKVKPTRFRRYLQSFPEEIYDLQDTSHIVRLLDALCGEAGIGEAKRVDFVKRLQTSLNTMRFNDLDELYGDTFGLPRLENEKYTYDISELISYEAQQEIQIKDSMYRARISKYMAAFQYGGTKRGIKLAAEAALGVRCEVVSSREYYQSRGIANGTTDIVIPLGYDDTADYDEYVIIAMTEQPLTAEQTYGVYTAAKRIRPVNALMTVKTLADIPMIATDVKDENIQSNSITASSSWWNIDRYVTGRLDWAGGGWVEAGVEKQAPRQIMVNSQEDTIDFTSAITGSSASSEHIGHYNRYNAEMFPALKKNTSEMKSGYAIKSATAKTVTCAIYGDTQAVDGYYPIDSIDEMTAYAQEDYRAYRYWSSVEAESGEEWVEFDMERILPVNRVEVSLFRKPMNVYLYASSSVDNGERVWSRVLGEGYVPLVYRIDAWGGTSVAGSSVGAVFKFPTIEADAFKLVFERLDVPYFKAVGDGAYERQVFPYSVEAMDFSVHYDIRNQSDYRNVTYSDQFGNQTRLSLRVMSPDQMGVANGYWVSQPNVDEDAVEWLMFDVRSDGKPVRINRIDVDAVYGGCQVNLYYSNDGNEWFPYDTTFRLDDGSFNIPAHEVSFIKMEFTHLCPIPYRVIADDIVVKERVFPKSVIADCYRDVKMGRGWTGTDMLLGVKSNYDGRLGGVGTYKSYAASPVLTAYGDAVAGEGVSIQPNVVVGGGYPIAPVRFVETGEHEYDMKQTYRSANLAYVVGIKSVSFSYESHSLAVNRDEGWIVNAYDENLIGEVDNWVWNGNRYYPASHDVVGSLSSVDLTAVLPFRSFSFKTEQREPNEMFLHPSDMAQDWHGYNSDVATVTFGSSGSVLQANFDGASSGIESEPVLMSARAMADVNAEVFSNSDTVWFLDCLDGAGETVFSSKFTVNKGKWTRLGTVFTPMPAGTWWDTTYNKRLRLPVTGPISVGDSIFCLLAQGSPAADLGEYQVVYFNGAVNTVLDMDCTSKRELWFNCQQELGEGETASSFYNRSNGKYYGAYYLYFKDSGWTDHEDYAEMYDHVPYSYLNDVVLADEGFIDFTYDGTGGTARKYLFDYRDEVKAIKCYVYGKQIYVEIYDGDKISGYVSDLTSQSEDLFSVSPTHLLLQWGKMGTAQVKVDGVVFDQMWRRQIRMWINTSNSYRELPCINNVYDEMTYSNGEY